MNFPGITVGRHCTVSHTVGEEDCSGNYLPDDVQPLLSTGAIASLVAEASTALIDPLLPDGFISLGKSSSIVHEHPSVVGALISLTVTIRSFDGYHITLDVSAHDQTGLVATGSHVRSIVNKRWLRVRIGGRIAALAR